MPRRLLLTVSTALMLFGMYAIYALTVSPLFTPETLEQAPELVRQAPPVAPESQNRQMASKWLPDYTWASDAKYQVRTAQAYIYAEDWQKVLPAGDVRFRPFALIYVPENKPGREPLVVVADSALVKFTAPFDESNPKPGRVVAGALEGAVEIRGAQGLAIKTRNVNFSEAALRVWSDEPIDFRYGINQGSGLGLELDLIPGPPTDDKPGVTGVRTLRIRRDVTLNLSSKPKPGRKDDRLKITSVGNFEYQLEAKLATFRDQVHVEHPTEKEQWDTLDCSELAVVFEAKPKPPANAPAGTAVAAAPPPAEGKGDEDEDLDFRRMRGIGDAAKGQPARLVSQRGGLVALCSEVTYDRLLRVATLKDPNSVHVTQKTNILKSPEITIVHEEKGRIVEALCRGQGTIESYAADATKPGGRGSLEFTGSWQRQLHKHPDAETGLDLIQFDGAAKLSQPRQLTLGGDTIFVWATPDKPTSLKPATEQADADANKKAEGAEKIAATPAGAGADRTAQVKKVVAVKSVTFQGDRLNGTAERLEINIAEGKLPLVPPAGIARDPNGPSTSLMFDPRPARSERDEVPLFVTVREDALTRSPNRLLLTADRRPVRRTAPLPPASRSASGRTIFMAVDDAAPPANPSSGPVIQPGQSKPAGKAVPGRPPAPAAGVVTIPSAAGPGAVVPAAAISGPAKPVDTKTGTSPGSAESPSKGTAVPGAKPALPVPEPVKVVSDVIKVSMIRDGKQMEASVVETEGHVVVTQPRAGQPALVVNGDWLELKNYSKTQQVVHVKGNPARIVDPKMELEGSDLHLDTVANAARVEGAGVLHLPVSKGLDGKQLAQPEKLHVRWTKRMEFDGILARFYVGVEATLDENKLTCHEMDVTLTKRVSFSDGTDGSRPKGPAPSASTGPAADVRTIHCKEGVELFAYEYDPEKKLKAFRKGAMWDMTFDQRSGDTLAQGPGVMTMWWKGDAAREGLASTAVVRANKARQTERAEWNYARIDFAETMQGNTKDRATLFRERVVVVYGPVNGTAEVIDPDKLPENGGWLRCGMLRLTQIAGPNKKDHLEMVGTGNSELDGRTKNGIFHALADVVSFDESKGLYILRSEGNRKAKLWRQVSVGREPQRSESQRLEFNPEQNSLKSDRTTTIDGLE